MINCATQAGTTFSATTFPGHFAALGMAVTAMGEDASSYHLTTPQSHLISDAHPRAVSLAPLFGGGGPSQSGRTNRVNGGNTPPSGGDGKGGVMTVRIGDLMETSGVKFGTSGARGLADKMTDFVCFAYTMGFLQYLMEQGEIRKGSKVVIAGDLRPSTDRIMRACGNAAAHMGIEIVNGGKVPSPRRRTME